MQGTVILEQENLLYLRGTVVSKDSESYADAMKMFYRIPGWHCTQTIFGHAYPKKRKSCVSKEARIDVLVTIHGLVSFDNESDESDINSISSISNIDLDLSDDSDKWSNQEGMPY